VNKIVIIGGGVIGVSIAWRLARDGAHVTVLERGVVGNEASWAAAGMIAAQSDAHEAGPFFDFCLRARDAFAAAIETLRLESSVDPEYDHAGILYLAFDQAEQRGLEHRARWQRAAGGTVEELSGAQARQREPAISPEAICALHLPLDRRVDSRKITQAYAAAARLKGATIVENAAVDSVIVANGRATAVRTRDGNSYPADVVINAAGAWASQVSGLSQDRIEIVPVRGQMLCFETTPGTLSCSIFSAHGYLVPRRDGRILAGSTVEEAGYDKIVTLAGIDQLARGALRLVPGVAAIRFREAWAGLRPASPDRLPVIGSSPSVPNAFYATGHYRDGIMLSAITGEIIADLVAGRAPSLDLAPFAPARFGAAPKLKALGLVRDLLLRSRIDGVADQLGLEVAYASDLVRARERAAQLKPAIVFADLSDAGFPAEATAREIRAAAATARMIGFASHVDLKSLASARAAGFDLTLSRSEFTARLPELFKP
jgi:glycine oxidase